MPEVTVWVDYADVLDRMKTARLVEELRDRAKAGDDVARAALAMPPDDISPPVAESIRTAFYARDASRLEALLAPFDPAPIRRTADA